MTSARKTTHRDYKTLEQETIVLLSSIYAVVSVFLVGIVFRFWLPTTTSLTQGLVAGLYLIASVAFLALIAWQSTRRTKINKLPSADITELCYLIKENSQEQSKCWHTTQDTFNRRAMTLLFGADISSRVPAHHYFSYMLSERYIEIAVKTIDALNPVNDNLPIRLTKKANTHLGIYEDAKHW